MTLRPLPPPTCSRRGPLAPTPPPDVYSVPPPPLTLFPNKCALPPRLRASALSGCGFGSPGADAMPVPPASALAVPPLPVAVLSALRALGRPVSVGEVVTTRGGARWRLVYASSADSGHVVVDRLDDDEAVSDYPLPPVVTRAAAERAAAEGKGGGARRAARRRRRNRAAGWRAPHRPPRRKPSRAAAVTKEGVGSVDGGPCSVRAGGCACPRIEPWRLALGIPAA